MKILLPIFLAAAQSAATAPPASPTPGDGAATPAAEVLTVAGVSIAPGEKRALNLPMSETYAGAAVDVPVVVVRGEKPGPVLCLVAGIHGDELNGIEIVWEILETHRASDLSGTIIGIPLANPFGFTHQSRYLPDRRDLNRHFPGGPEGSTAARMAHGLWTGVIGACTYLIDFHTGSLHRTNLPQVRADLDSPAVLELARAFGAPVVVHSDGRQGTLRRSAVHAGIPAILYEAGETMRFQREQVHKGVLGVRNAMVALGMRAGRRVDLGPQTVFRKSRWVRAEKGGMLELYPRLGEWIEEGDIIGMVSDATRREKSVVVSPVSGRVIGKVQAPMVIPGLAVVHVGLMDPALAEAAAD